LTDVAKVSAATVTRAAIGAIACSANRNEASVNFPVDCRVFCNEMRARLG
jgi:hypothetical protein